MHKDCGLCLGPNIWVQLAADKKIYLRLTVNKMRAFSDFTDKYLVPHGRRDTNVTAAVSCTNPKTEI